MMRLAPLHSALLAFGLVLYGLNPTSVTTITVTSLDDSGAGTLRQALLDAAAGDTIDFAVTGTITITGPRLVIDKNLTISGPGATSLAISGNNVFVAVPLLTVASGVSADISGVTISGGVNVTFLSCGGNILNNGTLHIADSVVTLGGTSHNGGNICNHEQLGLSNTAITGGGAPSGGGIYSDGHVEMNGGSLSQNRATSGGGLYDANIVATFNGVTFSQNFAFNGGATYQDGGQLNLNNCAIDGNTAWQNGAGLYNTGGSLNLYGVTISSNIASQSGAGSGGGAYVDSGSLWATNTTIWDNFALTAGGGIWTNNDHGGSLVLFFSTLVNDRTLGPGGGIFNGSSGRTMDMKGTVLARNMAFGIVGIGNCAVASGVADSRRNLSDDASCANAMTGIGDLNGVWANVDPQGLRDNGGPTKTLALLGSSPAVDAIPGGPFGDCYRFAPNDQVTFDQRGVARPQGNGCDMGAFELTDSTPPVVSVPLSIVVDATTRAGAIVTFSVTASDPDDAAGPVTCTPPSGSLFAIGTTSQVTCSSTDTHGNTGTASFYVTVLTPQQTLANLIDTTGSAGFKQSTNLLQNVLDGLARGNPTSACNQIAAFKNMVRAQAGKSLDLATANSLLASAANVEASLGCR